VKSERVKSEPVGVVEAVVVVMLVVVMLEQHLWAAGEERVGASQHPEVADGEQVGESQHPVVEDRYYIIKVVARGFINLSISIVHFNLVWL
jgi:hypothetical protein